MNRYVLHTKWPLWVYDGQVLQEVDPSKPFGPGQYVSLGQSGCPSGCSASLPHRHFRQYGRDWNGIFRFRDILMRTIHVPSSESTYGLLAAEWVDNSTYRQPYLGIDRSILEIKTRIQQPKEAEPVLTFKVNPPQPQHKTKRFADFAIGDIVVSPQTHNAGIKTGPRAVRWEDAYGGTARTCLTVDPNERYVVPSSVQVVVQL